MENIIEEITKLTDEWYKLIGKDHHKTKDCHWYIETKWSYGLSPTYEVQHWGYILDDITIKCSSYELALQELKKYLIIEIMQYKMDQEEDISCE